MSLSPQTDDIAMRTAAPGGGGGRGEGGMGSHTMTANTCGMRGASKGDVSDVLSVMAAVVASCEDKCGGVAEHW